MTRPDDDIIKRKTSSSDPLTEHYNWLKPEDVASVGGELLFDEYDDGIVTQPAADPDLVGELSAVQASLESGLKNVSASQPSKSLEFEDDIEDLIIFSDEEFDEEDEEEDEDEEDFEFEDDDDEDDDEDDEFDDDDDDDEDDEEEDELEDEDLIFEDDAAPKPRKLSTPPVRETVARNEPVARSGGGRTVSGRGAQETERDDLPASGRSDSREGQRKGPPAKATPAVAKSDDSYWEELDRWVWSDAGKAPVPKAEVELDDDLDDDADDDLDVVSEDVEEAETAESGDSERTGKRRRRRGGRGRGRRRRSESADADRQPAPAVAARDLDDDEDDDDLADILFEEDQEDFVSVSVGSAKAQRKQPVAEPVVVDDELDDDEDDEPVRNDADTDEKKTGRRRGRRGRRGRGRGRDGERGAQTEKAPVSRDRADADEFEDDDEDDDTLFADIDDDPIDEVEEVRPRGGNRQRPPETRGNEAPRGRETGSGGRDGGRRERQSRDREPEPREAAREESSRKPERTREDTRQPRPARDAERTPREPAPQRAQAAAEFADIPTWEEAIGHLVLKHPSEEFARRAGNRSRPPRGGGRGGNDRGGDRSGGDRGGNDRAASGDRSGSRGPERGSSGRGGDRPAERTAERPAEGSGGNRSERPERSSRESSTDRGERSARPPRRS